MGGPRHYGGVYRQFLATSVTQATSFRAHFVLLLVMELIFYATTLASIDILYDHVSHVGVWNREQFLFFVSYMLALDQLHMTFVSEGFWRLSLKIRQGDLDFDLLKPLSLFFTVFFRYVRAGTFLLLPVTWALVAWYGVAAGLPGWAWLALPPLLLLSFALLVALEVLLATAMFVTVDGTGINFLRMQFQTLSRWPDFVYSPWPRRVFTFLVPVLAIGNAPVRFLFDPRDSLLLLALVPMLGIVLAANAWLWRRALDGYSSASS